MQEERKQFGFHKLEVGQKIRVFKTTWNDQNYYKFQVVQNNYDKTKSKFYIMLQFKKGVDVPNEQDIIVHQFVENLRENKNDKYNPIHYYQIIDFEEVESQEQIQRDAFDEYRENLDELDQVNIDDSFLD
jgi:hypothetical protein